MNILQRPETTPDSVHHYMRMVVQDQGMRKINRPVEVRGQAGIWKIFRRLFFKHTADIGQKDHLWMDTN
jgi:hypothetical protein